MANPSFLAHKAGDYVAVAVRDVSHGEALVGYLDGTDGETVEVTAEIPLGHKVALRDVPSGDDVIEYGVRTAIASADITRGDYAHTHNLRSARWQNSVA
ncbi:MAG TPA: UxaA family hydrolase [Nocardioides sp.]|nr:UxaA family hydrolase [Nocardioides sp.]